MTHSVRLVPVGPGNKQFLVNVMGETDNHVGGREDMTCDDNCCNKLYNIHPAEELPRICVLCDGTFRY